ncbi:MAG TPA: hypothetical protein VGK73_11890 [Polyangiaceae bacterium]
MHSIHRKSPAVSAAFFALALLAAARPAAAQATPPSGAPAEDAKAQCGASFEKAQTDKLAGHYIAAKESALACSQLECNAIIVRECVQLYDSLERDIPTLVVAARTSGGVELPDVRVEMDGQLVAERITGRSFTVDPGVHEFVFIHPRHGRVELRAPARVGDRARVIEGIFEDPLARKKQAPAGEAPSSAPAAAESKSAIPVMSYVLGGIGVAGVAGFIGFRMSAVSDYNEYASTCSPACTPEDVDAVGSKFLLSYVSLGVGAASLAGAALVFVLDGGGGSSERQVQASVAPRPDGAVVRLKTNF